MAKKINKHDLSVSASSLAIPAPSPTDNVVTGTSGDDFLQGEHQLVNYIDAGDGNDTLIGGREADTLIGGNGDDYLDGMAGADLLFGGAGADVFKIHSWAYSNATYGMDTIADFSLAEGDKIDLTNIKHYFDTVGLGDYLDFDTRALTFADITMDPIADGNVVHASVWEGDTFYDVDIIVLGDTPDASSFLF